MQAALLFSRRRSNEHRPEVGAKGYHETGQKMHDSSKLGKYMELALLLPISTVIGYAMGYGLDKLFHTHFLYLVFLLFGIAAGLIQLIRELQKDSADGS